MTDRVLNLGDLGAFARKLLLLNREIRERTAGLPYAEEMEPLMNAKGRGEIINSWGSHGGTETRRKTGF